MAFIKVHATITITEQKVLPLFCLDSLTSHGDFFSLGFSFELESIKNHAYG